MSMRGLIRPFSGQSGLVRFEVTYIRVHATGILYECRVYVDPIEIPLQLRLIACIECEWCPSINNWGAHSSAAD